ncbi:DUF4097 family beta strand repeat-containing protein [Dyadobacter sp. CY323]|uniref:DUF4097 family beta strand repeat-containing protein n=1 Tax=Dyadobacter sp. CY323 TaxID=2907302 RepID=UPI001F47D152|nr:DUF4097 family beta strand repeat-containing protein [Dyadobacter sp. CY323]MCE6989955.1 DUF4097 family beta strand repeat-containing protein [Dyadobacter sp. CY323]
MKTNSIISLAVSIALTFVQTRLLAQAESKETLTVPLSDPSKPATLDVGILYGSIHVTGYAGNHVVIDASSKTEERRDKPNDEQAGGMKRISPRNAGLDITATEQNNTVKINSRVNHNILTLNIKVPLKCKLKVSTVNDGDIIVENVDGELEIKNVNGDIRLTNVSGSAVANTINGTLKATFKNVNTTSPMAFSTLNGNVDVTLPAAAKFDVRIKSDRGEIYSDFDVDVDKSQPQATRSAKDGMYKVSIEDWVKGKVNGGGGEIMMKNMNGNIYVRKAK